MDGVHRPERPTLKDLHGTRDHGTSDVDNTCVCNVGEQCRLRPLILRSVQLTLASTPAQRGNNLERAEHGDADTGGVGEDSLKVVAARLCDVPLYQRGRVEEDIQDRDFLSSRTARASDVPRVTRRSPGRRQAGIPGPASAGTIFAIVFPCRCTRTVSPLSTRSRTSDARCLNSVKLMVFMISACSKPALNVRFCTLVHNCAGGYPVYESFQVGARRP